MLRTLSDQEVKKSTDAAFKQLFPKTIFNFYIAGASVSEQHHAIVAKRISDTQVEIILLDEILILNQIKRQLLSRNQIGLMNLLKNYETRLLFRDYEKSVDIFSENKKPYKVSLQAPSQHAYEQGKHQIDQEFVVFKREKDTSMRGIRNGQTEIMPLEWFTLTNAAERKVYALLKNRLGWTDKSVDPRFF